MQRRRETDAVLSSWKHIFGFVHIWRCVLQVAQIRA